ncbi:hypothetical protein GCM10009127_23750 [Alteraurantiacibacter aestuarii]|uniref:sensor histidine kinase n=1 Tax=Alteraurantiacibacter aestuarii TaxID=650004 RepID=UPI0031D88F4A
MLFDDRLATVLRADVGSERAARTQYRQLLDLLGSSSEQEQGEMSAAAYARLATLSRLIPAEEQSQILREPGLRLRNRQLVEFLANGEARLAASALATAQLRDEDWQQLIPQLPVMARGFLRHRRNLPAGARKVLRQLGVGDLVLPQPDGPANADEAAVQPAATLTTAVSGERDADGIRALLRRIEAFREGKKVAPSAPRLPLGDSEDAEEIASFALFEFTSDAEGRIDWASSEIAPLVIGMRLARRGPGVIAEVDDRTAKALREMQPVRSGHLQIDGTPAISGEWRIDAQPMFRPGSGQFAGFMGRIYRPVYADEPSEISTPDSPGERMRQVLHELRTPVNAIQGFAEIIQQQLFGPAPNEYRALAAAVTVDAAKLLAAFDEVDRLSKLETATLELESGDADLRDTLTETIRRLDGALRARGAGFDLEVTGSPFTTALARDELMAISWRILASFAGALAPSERTQVRLASDGEDITVKLQLPCAIAALEDPLATRIPESRPVISAGMFGTGFSLRLAQAEVIAAGGTFAFTDDILCVTLPLLTVEDAKPSTELRDGNAA